MLRYAVSALALTMLSLLTAVACTGESPPPDPTVTEVITQPPTATQPNQPTQPQTLSPTRRTPIQTLNPGQIQATRQAQLATIKAQIPPPPAPSHLSDSPAPISDACALAHVCARTLAIPHTGTAAAYS